MFQLHSLKSLQRSLIPTAANNLNKGNTLEVLESDDDDLWLNRRSGKCIASNYPERRWEMEIGVMHKTTEIR